MRIKKKKNAGGRGRGRGNEWHTFGTDYTIMHKYVLMSF